MPDSEVPDGWRRVRLGEILRLEYGSSLPESARRDGEIPVVGSAGVVGRHSGASVKGPGVVVGRKGSIGRVIWLHSDFWPIDTTYYVEPVHCKCDLRWAYQLLKTLNLARLNRATGVPGLNRDDVHALVRMVPEREEQARIAEVLDSIDAAVEQTEAVIEATERLRSALLRELLTHGVPGWHTEWKDVPGIGTIPACWEVVRLGEVLADGPDNGLYKPEQEYGSGIWIIRITDFSPGRLERTWFDRVNASAEEAATYQVSEGDILINRVNSLSHLGKAVLLPRLSEPAIFESNMMRVRLASSILPEYAIKVLCSPATRRFFLARAKKAVAQASINQTDIRQLVMPLPTREEQGTLVAAVARLDERTTVEAQALTALTAVKAAAARALLSGRVRVPNAAREA